jgi:hypothetical protein
MFPAYDDRGVVQDAAIGTLPMLEWMNEEVLRKMCEPRLRVRLYEVPGRP